MRPFNLIELEIHLAKGLKTLKMLSVSGRCDNNSFCFCKKIKLQYLHKIHL